MSPLNLVVVVLAIISPVLADYWHDLEVDAKLYNATQSSTLDEYRSAADHAIDGDDKTASTTAFLYGTHWWQASMEVMLVRQVELSAFSMLRSVSFGKKGDVTVSLYSGDTLTGHCGDYKVRHDNRRLKKTLDCHSIRADHEGMHIIDDRMRADRVKLTIGGDTEGYQITFGVREIRVIGLALENVALEGKAEQSSDYKFYNGTAGKAIDGKTNGNFFIGSCTHTSETATSMVSPWWQVVLKRGGIISHVVVYIREDCCSDRIDGARVLTYTGPSMNLCGTIKYVPGTTRYEIPCGQSTTGDTVRIEGVDGKPLTLCEVEVMARKTAPEVCEDRRGMKCKKSSCKYERYRKEKCPVTCGTCE